MKHLAPEILLLCAGLFTSGCATGGGDGVDPLAPAAVGPTAIARVRGLSAEVKSSILQLDPERVTERDLRELLSPAPAPRIICIHGGVLPIKAGMNSFAEFLIGMGYPASSLRKPEDGSYSYGFYDRSERIAATVAWYYERDGLRPMIVGHSRGGIQTVRVLHKLAGDSTSRIALWNPLTRTEEQRCEIMDPLTGAVRPIVGLQVSYASAALAGGLARALPKEWDMNAKLRLIPDSVGEFTGFSKGLDPLGGDLLGFGRGNEFRATGCARVRNVRLPPAGSHSMIPHAKSLLRDPAVVSWIQLYQPDSGGGDVANSAMESPRKSARVLWAAEVWHSIKKHWVLELQRLIRAQVKITGHHDR